MDPIRPKHVFKEQSFLTTAPSLALYQDKRNGRLEHRASFTSLRGQYGKRETRVHHRAVRDALPDMHREALVVGATVVRRDERCVLMVLRGDDDAIGALDRIREDDADLSQGSPSDHF